MVHLIVINISLLADCIQETFLVLRVFWEAALDLVCGSWCWTELKRMGKKCHKSRQKGVKWAKVEKRLFCVVVPLQNTPLLYLVVKDNVTSSLNDILLPSPKSYNCPLSPSTSTLHDVFKSFELNSLVLLSEIQRQFKCWSESQHLCGWCLHSVNPLSLKSVSLRFQ